MKDSKLKGSSSTSIKPPEGPQRQHHRMATGGGLTSAPEGSTEKADGWGKNSSHPGKVHKSGTSTGK